MLLELWVLISYTLLSLIGSFFILRNNWKRYGILYILSAFIGTILCFLFVVLGFYSFPVTIIPNSPIPLIQMFTVLPFFVILGVMFSPVRWVWKIPYYWGLVHVITLQEVIFLYQPIQLIQFHNWGVWTSYTWWWIYFLVFEWIGGRIIPGDSRRPIQSKSFRYGRWAWFVFHFIVILTIFLGGFYLGRVTR